MKVYHYTHKFKWAAMQLSDYGRPVDIQHLALGLNVTKKGSKMFHPAKSKSAGSSVLENAFWAFETPLPEKWLQKKNVRKGLRELFQHCAGGLYYNLTLLEIDLKDGADIWAADWHEAGV